MSQLDLADASGISQQLISQIETGKNQTTKELPALAAALSAGVHEIDENFVPIDSDGYEVVALSSDGAKTVLMQYKFVGNPDPADAELIALLAAASPKEREEFLFLLRHRRETATP